MVTAAKLVTSLSRPRNFDDVLAKLPGAKQSGDHWTVPCPLPGHKTPADHLTLKDVGDKALVTCHGGKHTYKDICQLLGFDSLYYRCNGSGGEWKAPTKRTVIRYPIHDTSGKVVAIHERYDGPKGKRFIWKLPDGTPGLGGLPVADLPLYGSERLPELPDGTLVVFTI